MNIGICDDEILMVEAIENLCKQYFLEVKEEFNCVKFFSAEEVLEYCRNTDNEGLDLLLLDIELKNINGIELKDMLLEEDKVWRIAFMSSHTEEVYEAYGIKTVNFIPKPIDYDSVQKTLSIVMAEIKKNVHIQIRDIKGNITDLGINDIYFIKAAGSYSEIYTKRSINSNEYILCVKKIIEVEEKLLGTSIIRVHKSYLVNMTNVVSVREQVVLRDNNICIPIGRKYREIAKDEFFKVMKHRVEIML